MGLAHLALASGFRINPPMVIISGSLLLSCPKCWGMKMMTILSGKNILNRITSSSQPFCSSDGGNKSTEKSGGGGDDGSSYSRSLYDEQYKALNNLDFMTAAKILFTDTPKTKKFGVDFHLVQLFFVCLPSLAVYVVAQYALSEMKKMDAELELKKQTESEAKAKEMDLKAAKEKSESDPRLLEVKERLAKLEEMVKEIAKGSKRQSSDPVKEGQGDPNEQRRTVQTKSDTSNMIWKARFRKNVQHPQVKSKQMGSHQLLRPCRMIRRLHKQIDSEDAKNQKDQLFSAFCFG